MNLAQMKQKYASVLAVAQEINVRLDHMHIQDGKLFLMAAAPNEACKNRVWHAIKTVDPAFPDLICDISIDSSLQAPAALPLVSIWPIAISYPAAGPRTNRPVNVQMTSKGEGTMINELLKRVTEKTGLSPDQAQSAVDAVIGFLKEKLPAPLAGSLESFISGQQNSAEGGLASQASAAVGSLFGSKK